MFIKTTWLISFSQSSCREMNEGVGKDKLKLKL